MGLLSVQARISLVNKLQLPCVLIIRMFVLFVFTDATLEVQIPYQSYTITNF